MDEVLKETEQRLIDVLEANVRLLKMVQEAKANCEYYHNAPESIRELLEFIQQQEQMIRCCDEMMLKAGRFRELCDEFLKISKDFKTRAGVAA